MLHSNEPKSYNTVERRENIIYFTIADKVSDEEAIRLKQLGLAFIQEIISEGLSQVSNYIDIQKSTFFSNQARKEWVEYLQNSAIYKTAIVGSHTNSIIKILATTIISLSSMENVAYFDNTNEAQKWLEI